MSIVGSYQGTLDASTVCPGSPSKEKTFDDQIQVEYNSVQVSVGCADVIPADVQDRSATLHTHSCPPTMSGPFVVTWTFSGTLTLDSSGQYLTADLHLLALATGADGGQTTCQATETGTLMSQFPH